MATKRALVFVADGTEEAEAVIVIDILRRAKIDVVVSSINPVSSVTCSRGVVLVPETSLESLLASQSPPDLASGYSAIILPGGDRGARTFAASESLQRLLKSAAVSSTPVILGAICAAPLALSTAGLIASRRITSHPAIRDALEGDFTYVERDVVVDGNLVTSRGPGTAFLFALQIVEMLCGNEVVEQIRTPLMIPHS